MPDDDAGQGGDDACWLGRVCDTCGALIEGLARRALLALQHPLAAGVMRKVVVYELLSLDGVAQDPDEFVDDWDDEMDARLGEVIATQDAVILGRRSYDEWSAFWPGTDIQPFSDFINPVAKYVATSTPLAREWTNTTVIDGDPVEFVRALKTGQGGEIGVHASISLAQALLAAGVVDQLRLVIAPKIAGSGRRLLEGLPPIVLEPIRSSISSGGHLLVDYWIVGEATAT